jgi:hypothetical protein
MPLWGITDESKPKWLTDSQKKEVYANESGWVVEGGSTMTGNGNADAQPEVLACIGDLDDRISEGTITEVEWISSGFDRTTGGTLQVRVRYNESVTVTGTPELTVTNGNQGSGSGRTIPALEYASGSDSNELVFSKAIAAGANNTALSDELTIGAQSIAKPGGAKIEDTGTTNNSSVVISAAIGSAAGTIIVTES